MQGRLRINKKKLTMSDKKNKKKTLTISTNLTKKIDISSLSRDGKKAFSIDKKKTLQTY